jgi:hypothetical protein
MPFPASRSIDVVLATAFVLTWCALGLVTVLVDSDAPDPVPAVEACATDRVGTPCTTSVGVGADETGR